MGKPAYPILMAALASIIAVPQLAAFAQAPGQHQHEQPPRKPPQRPQFSRPQPGQAHSLPQSRHFYPSPGGEFTSQGPRHAHRPLPSLDFEGHVYHGHAAWEHGRWHHAMRNGRYGWWWDVGSAWYFYPQPIVGPPPYVSDIEVVLPDGPDVPLIEGDYPPADESADPPPEETTFPPPRPLPPPSGQETVGDGTASDADISAEAEQRHGYYWWHDTCYYRYPSGAYAPVDPRYCY
jgi:hypothetical protein